MPRYLYQVISLLLSFSIAFSSPLAMAAGVTAAETKALAEVKKACNDPRQVSYSRKTKDKSGRWLYYPYLKKPDGQPFYCRAVGTKPVTKLPPRPLTDTETEATDKPCTNCGPSGVGQDISEMADQVAMAPACKPNKQTATQCTKDVVCTLTRDVLKMATPSLGMVGKYAIPKCGSTNASSGCGDKLALGIGNGIVDLIKGIGYLAAKSLQATGKFIYTTGKAVLTDGLNMARNFFSNKNVHKTDNTMSMVLIALQKLPKSKFVQFLKSPIAFITDFIKRMYFDSLESSKNLANCQEWTGVPLFSSCTKPADAWACLNCSDKLETICGMLGFATTDLASLFLAGVGIAKVAGKAGKLLSVIAKKTTRLSIKYVGKATTRKIIKVAGKVGAGVAVVAAPVVKALAVLDKIPIYKQYNRLEELSLSAGMKVGGGRAASAAAKTSRAADLMPDDADELAAATAGSSSSNGTDIITDSNGVSRRASDKTPNVDDDGKFVPDDVIPSNRLKSTQEAIAEVVASGPNIKRTTATDFTKDNSNRVVIEEPENLEYIERLSQPKPKGSRNYVFRDAYKKDNNTNLGFDRSTAITTTYVERVAEKLDALKAKYKNEVEIVRYEGANRLEVQVVPKNGKLPADFEKEMADIYKRATVEQHLYLKLNNLVRASDQPIEMFKFGSGPDANRANLAVRANKEFQGHLADYSWESRVTQSHLQTIYMRAQDAHREMKSLYSKSKIFDQKTGRLDPRIADIITKSKSADDLVNRLQPYHQFKDKNGKFLPKKDVYSADGKLIQRGSLSMAEDLIEYVDYSKLFGIEFYGPRSILDIDDARTASSGADISGQNGRNISHNTAIFDHDFDEIVDASIRAEDLATKEFNKIINEFIKNRSDVAKELGYEMEYVRAGDDVRTRFMKDGKEVKELPEYAKRKLGNCNDGIMCLRDSTHADRVFVEVDGQRIEMAKQDVTDISHNLEKELRPLLRKVTTEYDQRNFWVDVSADGKMTLNMSHPPNASLKELEKYKALEEKARKLFEKVVRGKKPSELKGLGLSVRTPPPTPEILAQHAEDVKRVNNQIIDPSESDASIAAARAASNRSIQPQEIRMSKIFDEMRAIKNKPLTEKSFVRLHLLNDEAIDLVESELKRKGVKYRVEDPTPDFKATDEMLADASRKRLDKGAPAPHDDPRRKFGIISKSKRIVIEIGPNNPKILNNAIEKYNTEIVFNPQFTSSMETYAAIAPHPTKPTFFYPVEDFFTNDFGVNTALLHEVRHLRHEQMKLDGIDLPYYIKLTAEDGAKLHPDVDGKPFYNDRLNFDELSTYDRDVSYIDAKKFEDNKPRKYRDGRVYEHLASNDELRSAAAFRLKVLSESAVESTKTVRAHIVDHPDSVTFNISADKKAPSTATIPYIKNGKKIGTMEVTLIRLNPSNAKQARKMLDDYLARVEEISDFHLARANKALEGAPPAPETPWATIYKPKEKPIKGGKSEATPSKIDSQLSLNLSRSAEASPNRVVAGDNVYAVSNSKYLGGKKTNLIVSPVDSWGGGPNADRLFTIHTRVTDDQQGLLFARTLAHELEAKTGKKFSVIEEKSNIFKIGDRYKIYVSPPDQARRLLPSQGSRELRVEIEKSPNEVQAADDLRLTLEERFKAQNNPDYLGSNPQYDLTTRDGRQDFTAATFHNYHANASSDARVGVRYMSGPEYRVILPYLRTGKREAFSRLSDLEIDKMVFAVDKSIADFKTPRPMKLYRALATDEIDSIWQKLSKNPASASAETFTDKAFGFTSLDNNFVEGWNKHELRGKGVILEIDAPAGTHAAHVDRGTGTTDYAEVILPRNQIYKVVRAYTDESGVRRLVVQLVQEPSNAKRASQILDNQPKKTESTRSAEQADAHVIAKKEYWALRDIKFDFRHDLGHDINDAQARFLLENDSTHPMTIHAKTGRSYEDIDPKLYDELEAVHLARTRKRIDETDLFTDADKYKLLLMQKNQTPRQRREYLIAEKPTIKSEEPTSASLDTGRQTTFQDLENRMQKVENQFEFDEPYEKKNFFYFRYSSPKNLTRAYTDDFSSDLAQAYIDKKFDPRQLIKRDYELVLDVAKNLGTEKLADINRRFAGAGHVDRVSGSKIYSLRLQSTVEVAGNKVRTPKSPSYRALLCRQTSGKIFVFAVYRKTSVDDSKYFEAYEKELYENARKKAESNAVKCIDPI